MIHHPLVILAALVIVEFLVLYFSSRPNLKRFFHIPPAVFWIYFIPMILSTIHVIPNESPVYQNISKFVLPASLILLLIGTDLPAIFRVGKTALVMMLIGSAGIIFGAVAVVVLFRPWLPENAWLGFATLSGSWVGGSANMVAAKEVLQTPDSIFLPMVVVDVVVAYSWMAFLIALEGFEERYDSWNHSRAEILEYLKKKTDFGASQQAKSFQVSNFIKLLFLVLSVTAFCLVASNFLPEFGGINRSAWVIIVSSVAGIALSFTKFREFESDGASRYGYWLLFLVLTSIGAKANLTNIFSAPVLILAGFVLVMIHFAFLFVASRIGKIPLALIATASQANVGGPVSTPIVAAVYHPALAPVGLLLGIFGNVIGTYAALLCAQLCYWVR